MSTNSLNLPEQRGSKRAIIVLFCASLYITLCCLMYGKGLENPFGKGGEGALWVPVRARSCFQTEVLVVRQQEDALKLCDFAPCSPADGT